MQQSDVESSASKATSEDTSGKTESQDGETLQSLSAHLHQRLTAFLEEKTEVSLIRQVQEQTKDALRVAQDALARYKFEELCMSYNGGKDCLVLLVIYLAAIHRHFSVPETSGLRADSHAQANGISTSPQYAAFPSTIKSVYIRPAHPFAEVNDFVHSSAEDYHLDLAESSKPMKAAFAEYLKDHTEVKAIFVGTRRTDPHGGSLGPFNPTDRGWPSFMRIHPVIDWHYQEIWGFIRHLGIPYCSLYDLGYTSLGGTTDTHPNPKLSVAERDSSGEVTGKLKYRPAYELQDDNEERLGRE